MEPHAQWRTNIERRTEDLTSDWWPFVENIKEILDKMDEMHHEFNQLENKKLLVEITLMKLCKVNQSNQINYKTSEKKKENIEKSIQDTKNKKKKPHQKN